MATGSRLPALRVQKNGKVLPATHRSVLHKTQPTICRLFGCFLANGGFPIGDNGKIYLTLVRKNGTLPPSLRFPTKEQLLKSIRKRK
jgi:hypothetical protein